MKIFGYDIRRLRNVDEKKPKAASVSAKTIYRQSIRVQQDITRWRDALKRCESTYNPEYKYLMELYLEISEDPAVRSVMNHITTEIQSREYYVKNAAGEEDEEATALLHQPWFEDVVMYLWQKKCWGFSMIELGDIVNDGFSCVKSIDRRYIFPLCAGVRTDYSKIVPDFYVTDRPYNAWTIFVKEDDYGLFNNIAPIWIYKKQAMNMWAEYQQIMAIPYRIGKTSYRDEDRRKNMERFLSDMASGQWGLFDLDDIVEIVQAGGTASGNSNFENMISYCDGMIAKVFLGGTMTVENGSSRSQAEVHERMQQQIINGYIREIQTELNKHLLELLYLHRIFTQPGLRICFRQNEENVTYMDKVDTLKSLLPYYDIAPEQVGLITGIPVQEKMETEADPGSPLNRLKNYYGPKHKH